MRQFIRDLMPYGLVIKYGNRKERMRREGLALERSRSLRQSSSGADEQTERLPRLNMGCGRHHEPSWWNLDASDDSDLQIWWDENGVLPFESDSLEVVFSEHFIEHVPLSAGIHFCHEAARVLGPGGVFRCSTPDFDWVVNSVENGGWNQLGQIYEQIGDFPAGALKRPSQVINWTFRGHGHQFLWSFEDFQEHLTSAGFVDIRRVKFGETRLPGSAIEIREPEDFCSIIVEATCC